MLGFLIKQITSLRLVSGDTQNQVFKYHMEGVTLPKSKVETKHHKKLNTNFLVRKSRGGHY